MSIGALARRSPTRRRWWVAFVALALALPLVPMGARDTARADTAPPIPGTPTTVSAKQLPTWQINGVVWSQVVVGNTVYATGLFTRARPPGMWQGGPTEVPVGHLIAYDIRTGNRIAEFNHHLNGQGLAITATPDGTRLYVGGDFTTADWQPRGHIAVFDITTPSGQLLPGPSTNGRVAALTASNSKVYAGGEFTFVNDGRARNKLAAFDRNGTADEIWKPGASQKVQAMVLTPDGSKVVIGGAFWSLNGQRVNGHGAVNSYSAALEPWAANGLIRVALNPATTYPDGAGAAITSLTTDGVSIFAGGYSFRAAPDGIFEGRYRADPRNGAIYWLDDCHGDTYGVFGVRDVVYSVGHPHDCTPIGGFPESGDGTPETRRFQHSVAFSMAANRVNTGPDAYGWNYAGAAAPTMLQWYPSMFVGTITGQYQAGWHVTGNSTYVVIGGEFTRVNDVPQQGLTRFGLGAAGDPTMGPTYTYNPPKPVPATRATVIPGTRRVRVDFGSAWDKDNEYLWYTLMRDGATPVGSVIAVPTNFWTVRSLAIEDPSGAEGRHAYTVRITDANGNALMSPASNPVDLGPNRPPVAALTSTQSGTTVFLDARGSTDPDSEPLAYDWDFGDGTTWINGGPQAAKKYAADGTYTVTLTVRDLSGLTNSTTRSVTAGNRAPVAALTAGAPSGRTVFFDGTRSSDPDGDAITYNWDFGDGTTWNGGGPQARKTFAADGTYTVRLTARDPAGLTATATVEVTVGNRAPTAALTATQRGSKSVFLDAVGSSDPDGDAITYTWDFGDGTTWNGGGPQALKTYTAAGTYTVTLTVRDPSGRTGTTTRQVTTTNAPPVAALTATPRPGRQAFLDATGSRDPDGDAITYDWDFGDGTTWNGGGPQALKTYAAPGTYTVTITVRDTAGSSNAATRSVTVAN